MPRGLKEKKLHYLIILAVCIFEISTHWGYWYPDSGTYVSTMEYIMGNESAVASEHRLLRPVYLALAIPLSRGVGSTNAFAIINTIFWIATAFLLYRFSVILLDDSLLALYSALLFSVSIPLLEYGAAVLTDSGGYFFAVLAFHLLYRYRASKSIKTYVGISILMTVGTLTREQTLLFLLIYMISYEVISGNRNWSRVFWIAGVTLVLISFYYTYIEFSPLSKFGDASKYSAAIGESMVVWGPIPFVKSTLGAFLFLPFFAVIGFHKSSLKLRRIYLLMLLSVSPVLIFWPVMDYRWFFLMFPALLPLSSLGSRSFFLKICGRGSLSMRCEILPLVLYAAVTNYYVFAKIGFRFVW